VNSSGCGASIGVAEARLMPRHRAGVPGWVRGVVGKSREALAMMDELEPDYRE